MKEYLFYCGGEFQKSDKRLVVTNPYDNSDFAYTYLADNQHIEEAIRKAQDSANLLWNLPSHKIETILLDIANELTKHRRALGEVLALEACKPLKYAISEIDRAAQTFRVAAQEALRLLGEHLSLDWTAAGEGKEACVKYFPVGVVAGISPFNFPINLATHKIASAIAARCPIVLKPASSTPLSTLELAKIIDNTALPKGALSVLPCNREVGNVLVTDDRIKLLSFTGSPAVGWEMKKRASKKKVVLELGGNAACIIGSTANLDLAIKKSVVGAFAYSGQVCIHAQRFFVHTSVYNEFLDRLIEETKLWKTGNPLEIETDMSSMIDEQNAIRVENWINEALAMGAILHLGGKREGNFVEPTILSGTNSSMKVNSEEVFGPVIVVEKFENFADAIDEVNNSKYGLQAGVFTNLIDEMNLAFDQLQCGGVIINDVPSYRADHMPYGGIKDSGLGREGVKYAIMEMMEPKILVKPK